MGSSNFHKFLNGVVAAVAVLSFIHEPCEAQQRRARVSGSGQQAVEFDCPEEFGYYPHPSDCTQYYVCVFGGALLESCTGGLMYSHELQTCDWPRNVGCGAEGESATISTVRVTDPRTRQTTPTGSPSSRTVPVPRGQQPQQREQQQRQQQEEIAKHQLYADDLGPAEEVESDRQQRVYRGQPSTVGQVARDRDGLRHQVTNAIPAPPGRVASGEKIGVISFGTAVQQQQQQPQQYSFDELTVDDNFLLTNVTLHSRREKRQVRYRFPGQSGPVLQLGRPGLNTFSVPVQGNGANYNSYQTFGATNNSPSPVPVPPAVPRPSNPASPPSSDNNYRPLPNSNIPNPDLRHFRTPENYVNSGQRPLPNIQYTQTNNNFKPRPPQSPNPTASVYNFRQFVNQLPASTADLRQQQLSVPLGLDPRQQQQPIAPTNNNINPFVQSQYVNPIGEFNPISFTNFQQNSDFFASAPPAYTGQQHVTPRDPSTPAVIYHNPHPHNDENYAYLVFDHPKPSPPPVQFSPSTENPASLHPLPNHSSTLQTLPTATNSLGFPHDTLSFDEIHKHEQRETNQHLVPPPPPPSQKTEAPIQYNNQPVQQTWQKLLREQQSQDDWSPIAQPTEPLPPAPTHIEHANAHHPASFSTNVQTQSTRPPISQTEGPFKPNTNPYGEDKFVGVIYKESNREVSERPRHNPDLYTKLPSSPVPNYNNVRNPEPFLSPPAPPPPSLPRETPHQNLQRPSAQAPILNPIQNTRSPITVEPNGNSGHQPYAVQNREVPLPDKQTSFPYEEYESVKTNNGKHLFAKPEDYQDALYDEYDDKAYYDDALPIEEEDNLERPQPSREPDIQYYNSGKSQTETKYKDQRREPNYKEKHNTERAPSTPTRITQKAESSEQRYERIHESQKLPSREIPNKSDSQNDKTQENSNTYSTTSVRPTTEDNFPHPPPEFYDDFNKYSDVVNPFASFDFDFDEYLDKLRGKPESSRNQETREEETSQINSHDDNENIRSTTQQNVPSHRDEATTTTTRKPRIRPSRKRPSQLQTTEYIKEYYPPERTETEYNSGKTEESGVHNKNVENVRNNQRDKSSSTNSDAIRHDYRQNSEITTTSTTYSPKSKIVTAIQSENPNPLTVPFYPGEDGNFYANPSHFRPDSEDGSLRSQADDYYKYGIDGIVQSTERNPRIVSTPSRDTFSNSKNNWNNQRLVDSTTTVSTVSVNTQHPVLEVITNPSRSPTFPRRGSVRIKPVENVRLSPNLNYNNHGSQTPQKHYTNDNSGSNRGLYNEAKLTIPSESEQRQKTKPPFATPQPPIPGRPHSFSGSIDDVYEQKYEEVPVPSTEITPPKPVATEETKSKKTFQPNYHSTFEENDMTKPLRDFRNERGNHKVLPSTSTSTIPSTTSEFITTSSTQYTTWETLNGWPGTTPYSKEVNTYEPTTTQPKYVEVTTSIESEYTHGGNKYNGSPEFTTTKYVNSANKFNPNIELTTPTIEYTSTIVHDSYSTTSGAYSGPQTSTRPSNELLESVYDIAKSMFNSENEGTVPSKASKTLYIEPSSEDGIPIAVTETNTTSTASHTVRAKPRRRRPFNKSSTSPNPIHHIAEYPTTGSDLNDHTTPETYTIRRRPSKDYPTRQRVRRPLTNTTASAIATTLPSNDIDSTFTTTVKSPSPIRSRPPTGRRHRRPTKTKVDINTTEAHDNDKSESYDRPLQDSTNKLIKKPLPDQGSRTSSTPLRVEPSLAPVTFVQQPAVQPAATPNVYNNSQRYDPTQYDPYYNLYDDEVEIYRDVADYSQYPSNQGSRQSGNTQQQPTYRGQSPYKQPPQAPPQEAQRNAAYAQPSYNNQQDVYVQNIDPQEYNENYNTATDDQYNQQGVRQPAKSRGDRNELNYALQSPSTTSTTIPTTTTTITTTTTTAPSTTTTTTTTVIPSRQQTRLRVDPTTATNNNKYNAVLAAISTSSPSFKTTSSHFPSISDFDTPYLLTLKESSPQPSSRQANPTAASTSPRQNNNQSRRITLTTAFSLDDPFSTSSKPSRSRGSPQRISIQPSADLSTGRRKSETVTLGASLSGTTRSASQNGATSRGQDSSVRRTATKSFTVIDNTETNQKSSILDAEISALENLFKQNDVQRRGEDRGRSVSRSDSRTQNQNQRSSEPVQRSRLVSDTALAPQNESPSNAGSARSRRPEPSARSGIETVTPRSASRTASAEIVSSPSIRIASPSRNSETQQDSKPTSSPSALRSSFRASLVEADDVHSGLSRNSIVPQTEAPNNNRGRSRGGSQRKPSSCADAVDNNSDAGCDEKPQIRVRPTTASPDSQSTPAPARGNNAGRNRGSSYTTASGAEPTVNRGTPATVSRSRPTLKPSTAIVSKAQEFIDIYRYPPKRADPVYPTPQVDKTAAKCRKDVCLLPDCYCGGKDIPGDLPAEEVPQIVLLTFDDAINDLNKGLYQDIFEKGRKNPNGCPITATFYVSHEWTDYSQAQNLYADGHEMASHSISHSFGEQFSQKKWTKEIAGQREILAAYGGVRLEDVRGMRAPFLAIGGNKMFKMLYDSNFTYDSSMPVYENRPPSWPYTLDYKIFHDCMIPPCPTRSYPGVWEVPMVMWQDLNGGRCSMGDACSNPPTADGVYKMLIKNFERHYTTNRAPFGLFYHAAWFTQPHHKEGFIAFLDTIVNMQDVWLVTNWQAIQWVRDPTPLSRINSFPPFQCNYPERPKRCNNPKVCNLWHKSGVRYMRTCQPCPDVYPWTGKTGVRNSRVDNEIIEES